MYKEVLFMKLKDLLLVADCNYHVFFKSEIANISGLPYEEIQKEQLKDYLDMTVLRVVHMTEKWCACSAPSVYL